MPHRHGVGWAMPRLALVLSILVALLAGSATSATAAPVPTATWVQAENDNPGTTDWFVPADQSAPESSLAGYADSASVLPGQPIQLRIDNQVSTTQRITAYRLGWYQGTGGREVSATSWLPAAAQPPAQLVKDVNGRKVNRIDASHWTTSATMDTTGWLPGSYVLVVEADTGERTMIPTTVRSSDVVGRTVLVNATPTWQAYNRYGGYSAYRGFNPETGVFTTVERSRQISMNRPLDRAFGVDHFLVMERGLVAEAERLGLDLGYLSSVDLSTRAGANLVRGARAIVSLGHDEYWSNEFAGSLAAARDAGTNLLFAGANSMWWRVRFTADLRSFDVYKSAVEDPVKDPTLATVNFSTENNVSLLGSRFACSGVNAPLVVLDPGMFLFRGTGATNGSSYPGLNRIEVDRAVPSSANPPTLSLAAHSLVDCRGTEILAHITWYTAPSRAGVINFGSMGFALAADPLNRGRYPMPQRSVDFALTVLGNALQEISIGPLGARQRPPANAAAILAQGTSPLGTAVVPLDLTRGSGVYGDVDGNRTADLFGQHRDGRLYLYGTSASGPRVTSTRIVGENWGRATYLGRVPDLNGDGVDELIARRDDGTLWLFRGYRGGAFTVQRQLGTGWGSMRSLAVVPDFLGNGTAVLLAIDARGRMTRRQLTSLTSGLGPAVEVGHGWNPRFLLSVHDFIGDGRANLVMIDHQGRMYAYTLVNGRVRTYGQVGWGWSNFTHAVVPGDINADGRWDLLGIRSDGNLYFYANSARARWAAARQIGWNWRGMDRIL